MKNTVVLVGAPVQTGTNIQGCLMGPDALRTAGLQDSLEALGYSVIDRGNILPEASRDRVHSNSAVHHLSETISWTEKLHDVALAEIREGHLPVFLGGDHSMAAGTVSGIARAAAEAGEEQFVLWLDAHPDFHNLSTTTSGNLHGTPAAYFCGLSGFEGYYPELNTTIKPENICMMGLRSVDNAERAALQKTGIETYDMRRIDENGVVKPINEFLERVKAANGRLHLSFDVDFLDPDIAPAVGTTVPGGATFREAHLIMEMLCDSQLVTSVDLVELNPFLDVRGRTATLMADLVCSLFGKQVLDHPNRA
ncbi:arginase [Pseudovibrio ascidiaceicola]|uniref:Arginase n=1 Tax=Pseudovibrio ascidiaceicola TaxID=285279 RepID=A0A1I3W0Y9_9HYPH|nr:arginase [Pseudovibrio ascidiaceicola]SFK00863.1 arginase [Pseudovibrio ascidiaceicola]